MSQSSLETKKDPSFLLIITIFINSWVSNYHSFRRFLASLHLRIKEPDYDLLNMKFVFYDDIGPTECGISVTKPRSRNVRGNKATSGVWPWQINIYWDGKRIFDKSCVNPVWKYTAH